MNNVPNLGIVTDEHIFFYGGVFSNWYMSDFTVPTRIGIPFPYVNVNCAEQAMMYYKAIFFEDFESANEILCAKHPRVQKRLGREVKNYDDERWSDIRYYIVLEILKRKFDKNPDLSVILLLTGNKKLVEASPTDDIWGIGLALGDDLIYNENEWCGSNLLGKALMEVREYLRN